MRRSLFGLGTVTCALACAAAVIISTGRGLPSASAAAQYVYPGEWTQRYNGLGNGFDSAFALGVSPDGSKVFVTGGSDGGASAEDYATVAYNAATGAPIWAQRDSGPGSGSDLAFALGASPNGSRVFVTGVSDGGVTRDDYMTAAYNA